jgi:hypothetical protein
MTIVYFYAICSFKNRKKRKLLTIFLARGFFLRWRWKVTLSTETSVLTRIARQHILEDDIIRANHGFIDDSYKNKWNINSECPHYADFHYSVTSPHLGFRFAFNAYYKILITAFVFWEKYYFRENLNVYLKQNSLYMVYKSFSLKKNWKPISLSRAGQERLTLSPLPATVCFRAATQKKNQWIIDERKNKQILKRKSINCN